MNEGSKHSDGDVALDDSVSIVETWEAMLKLPKSKAKAVGVSNHTIEHLETIIAATGVVPAVNQIERHPMLPQPDLVKYCAEKGIHITAYSVRKSFPTFIVSLSKGEKEKRGNMRLITIGIRKQRIRLPPPHHAPRNHRNCGPNLQGNREENHRCPRNPRLEPGRWPLSHPKICNALPHRRQLPRNRALLLRRRGHRCYD